MIRRPPKSPLFPSPTLFRSAVAAQREVLPLDARVTAVQGVHDADPPVALGVGQGPGQEGVRFAGHADAAQDRKSTRLNSSHANISYAVFCLKKKKKV